MIEQVVYLIKKTEIWYIYADLDRQLITLSRLSQSIRQRYKLVNL